MRRTLLAASLFACASTAFAADLRTTAEKSEFTRTGRYSEVIALCDAFAKQYPKSVRCFTFGTSPEGRPMKVMAVSTTGALTPQAAKAKALPVTLVQAGIHAGEIDGKDAVFWLLRDMLEGKAPAATLDKQVMLFVPVFNVDGHENFKAWNRPNQRGPEEMGFRVTAQRYNLNRDYVKADSPEMQAMLRLVNAWDPLAEIDLHVTDGAKFQHDISITGEPISSGDAELRKAGRALRDGIVAGLEKNGLLPVDFYPSFVEGDNPASGFAEGVSTPRFSHGYYVLRNRLAILVETHSWRTYPERVRSTRQSVISLLDQIATNGAQWQKTAHEADQRSARLGGQSLPLSYKFTDDKQIIDFKGYAYERVKSDISGDTMIHYDETKPQIWKVPLRNTVTPDVQVTLPRGGYIVPAAWVSRVQPKLEAHGITYRTLKQAGKFPVEMFRASEAKFSSASVEGHQRVTLTGAWAAAGNAEIGAGALFVPIAQPKARLVANLLEPQAPDAIAAWGDMNNAFEQKEYMEEYVAEEQAREMLAKDPALRAAFEKRLREDEAFAKSPRARLDFFYRLHPAYDQKLRLYPIMRTDRTP